MPLTTNKESTDFLGLKLKNNMVLAPLAGVSDASYRQICSEEGAGLVYTEMVSAKGLYYGSANTEELLIIPDGSAPTGIQLFTSEPEMMDFAIRKLADRNNAFFDINMGCPVPKVVKNGEGSFLLTNPDLAARIAEAAVKASMETCKKPVTVKMRIGFGECKDYVSFAKRLESAGVSAIAVHARTREQYYSGTADWNAIAEIKKAVSIPVIGNGDVRSREDAKKLMDISGCDLVMVGRGAMGNPWVFNPEGSDLKTAEEKCELIYKHLELLLENKGMPRACLEMRKFLSWYTKGMRGASELRQKINTASTPENIKELINEIKHF